MRNGTYNITVPIHTSAMTDGIWTAMPSAETFLFGSDRHIMAVELTGMSKICLNVNKQSAAGSADAKLILKYSPIFSTDIADYRDVGITEVSVPIDSADSFLTSGDIDINADAFAVTNIYLAIIGSGGNGIVSPQFGSISVNII